MSYERTAYDEADTATQMRADCAACEEVLPTQRRALDPAAPAPSLLHRDFAEGTVKPEIEVSEAAAHLASRLHLHLD